MSNVYIDMIREKISGEEQTSDIVGDLVAIRKSYEELKELKKNVCAIRQARQKVIKQRAGSEFQT